MVFSKAGGDPVAIGLAGLECIGKIQGHPLHPLVSEPAKFVPKVFVPSMLAPDRLAPCRSALDRSAPCRSAPERSNPDRFAPERFAILRPEMGSTVKTSGSELLGS